MHQVPATKCLPDLMTINFLETGPQTVCSASVAALCRADPHGDCMHEDQPKHDVLLTGRSNLVSITVNSKVITNPEETA